MQLAKFVTSDDPNGNKIVVGDIYFKITDNSKFFITLNRVEHHENRWCKVLYFDTRNSLSGKIEDVWISNQLYEKVS
jgi:hypothetical protein